MAAATMSPAIDLKSQATFPIHLGPSILKSSEAPQFTSIRYNHKPSVTRQSQSAEAKIQQKGQSAPESTLSLPVADGEYTYSGKHAQDAESYVLVLKGQGREREMVLERLHSNHAYNLASTPSESDTAKLNATFPPLPEGDIRDEDLFGDTDENGTPDESNPFDFRHFLKIELEKAEAANANLEASRATADTLQMPPAKKPTPSKPARRAEPKASATKKRKAPANSKTNSKRVKAGEEPPTPAEPVKPKAKPEIPKINMDRKASLRRPSLDDGDLIMENETPITEKPKQQGAMALALSGQLLKGPTSLQSAASSPGSHITSPVPQRPEAQESEYVFEFDDEPDAEGEEDDFGKEADDDVDNFELPSPAQAHRPSAGSAAAAAATAGGDDDDEMERQLELAMMEDDDGANQESEESEEE